MLHCEICCPHDGNPEVYCLLGCDALSPGTNSSMLIKINSASILRIKERIYVEDGGSACL
jgi:hypothetical protein